MDPRGHQIVPSALGGAAGQHRGLELHEAVLREVFPGDMGDLMAHHQVLLHDGPTKVQIPVLEPQKLPGVGIVADLKGRRLADGQDLEVPDLHLHLTGLHLGVHHVAGPGFQGAPDGQHVFRTDGGRPIVVLRAQGAAVEHHLHEAGPVPELDEDQRTQVAAHVAPAHQRHFPAHVRLSKLRAVAGAFPSLQQFTHDYCLLSFLQYPWR